MPQYKGKVPFPDSMLFGTGRGSNIQALVLIVSIAVAVIIVEIGWRSRLRPLSEDLLSGVTGSWPFFMSLSNMLLDFGQHYWIIL